jgi:hypothetical protein
MVPPALPSSWYRPPSFGSPLTGRNQRAMRSGLVQVPASEQVGKATIMLSAATAG